MQCRHAACATGPGSMHRRQAAPGIEARRRGDSPRGPFTRTRRALTSMDTSSGMTRVREEMSCRMVAAGRQAGKRRQAVGRGRQQCWAGESGLLGPRRWAGRHRPLRSSRTVCGAGGTPPPRCCRRRMAGRRPLAGRCCRTCGRCTAPSSSAGPQPAAPAMLHPGDGAQAAPGVTHRSVSPHRSFQEAEAGAAGPLGSSCCARPGLSSDPCACTSPAR